MDHCFSLAGIADQLDLVPSLLDPLQLGTMPLLVAHGYLMALKREIRRHENGRAAAANYGYPFHMKYLLLNFG